MITLLVILLALASVALVVMGFTLQLRNDEIGVLYKHISWLDNKAAASQRSSILHEPEPRFKLEDKDLLEFGGRL